MQTQELINYFQSHGGIAQLSDIINIGFYADSLNVLEKEGRVKKIAHGLYRMTNYANGFYSDLIAVSIQVPRGVICLHSALAFYGVMDKIPNCVNIAIQQGVVTNKIKYPLVMFYRFAPEVWKIGIERHEVEGYKIKIYSLAKTITDCFKFRNKMGMDVVRDALKIAITEKGVKPNEIMQYAELWRVDSVIGPILKTML